MTLYMIIRASLLAAGIYT